jgi:hypothetical protein
MRTARRFAATRASVAESRRFVVESLADVPVDVQDAVSLMVSELATNALMHATSEFELAIDRRATFVRVEVHDAGDGSPVLRSPSSNEPHGRGLRIVDELSDEWGASAAAGPGKSIWFVVRLEDASEPTDQSQGSSGLTPGPSPPMSSPAEASQLRSDRQGAQPHSDGRGASPQMREKRCPRRSHRGRPPGRCARLVGGGIGRGIGGDRHDGRPRPQAGVTRPGPVA